MNVLVLGGGGFIGSHIAEALGGQGINVRIFNRGSVLPFLNGDWVSGDFLDKALLLSALRDIDVVVHSLGTSVPATSTMDPIFDVESNLIGTLQLLAAMRESEVSRLIYLSSGGTVYGNTSFGLVSEDCPLSPISSYGAVKVAIEKFIGVAAHEWGLSPVILRPSNPYGERQAVGRQGLISNILDRVLKGQPVTVFGDGLNVRDYVYVRDLAELVVAAVCSDKAGTFNVGSGVGHTILDIIRLAERVTDTVIPVERMAARRFDVREIVLDCSSVASAFGWRAATDIESGMKAHFDWLKQRVVY